MKRVFMYLISFLLLGCEQKEVPKVCSLTSSLCSSIVKEEIFEKWYEADFSRLNNCLSAYINMKCDIQEFYKRTNTEWKIFEKSKN